MTAAPDIGARVYEAVVHVYPPAFRREFGVEMVHDFREASQETWDSNRWHGLVPFWLSIAVDLVMTVSLEWCRTGLPLLALVSAVPGVAFLGLLARMERPTLFVVPETAADRDVMAMLLLVLVLLLVIVTTMAFTLWFARPAVYRRR